MFGLVGGVTVVVCHDAFSVAEEVGLSACHVEEGDGAALEGGDDFFVGVGEEREGEFVFVAEGFLGFLGVVADAEDFDAFFLEFGPAIAEGAALGGAA